MAKYRGVDGTVEIATVAVGNVKSWNVTSSRAILDQTSITDTARAVDLDIVEWQGGMEVHFDYGDTKQAAMIDQAISGATASDLAVKLKISGSTKYVSGNVKINSVTITNGGKGSTVSMNVSFVGNGAVAITWS